MSIIDQGIIIPVPTGATAPGLFVPQGAGPTVLPNFKAKLRSGVQTRVAVVGDSIPWGGYASHIGSTGLGTDCVSLLRKQLQAAYGNGGSGLRSVYDCIASTAVANYGFLSTELGSNTGGPWNIYTGSGATDGPGALQLTNGPATGAGPFVAGTLTWLNVTGTTINLLCVDTNTTVNVTIDGGANIPIVLTNTSTVRRIQLAAGLSAGPHTVVASVGAFGVFICGVEGVNAGGVIVDGHTQIGYTSQSFANAQAWTQGFAPTWMGGTNTPADLVIYQLGVNDASNTVEPFLVSNAATGIIAAFNSYLDWVRTFLDGIRDNGRNPVPDILLWHPHIGNAEPAGPRKRAYSQYGMGFVGLAQEYGAAYLNFWADGRNSYKVWTDLGYWGNPAVPGAAGADAVHLSNAGHAYVANRLFQVCTS